MKGIDYDALLCFSGAPARVMIDKTHVVVLRGTGRDMVPVPEMAAFAERFGFAFVAPALGNAKRSARVERVFWFIERVKVIEGGHDDAVDVLAVQQRPVVAILGTFDPMCFSV